MTKSIKLLQCLGLLTLTLIAACEKGPDTVEASKKPPPLDLPPIEINVAASPSHVSLSQEELIGKWDIIRFDDFEPKYRLNGGGKRSAYVDFYNSKLLQGQISTSIHIGCNYSGNELILDISNDVHELTHVPRSLDHVATQQGCPSGLKTERDGISKPRTVMWMLSFYAKRGCVVTNSAVK